MKTTKFYIFAFMTMFMFSFGSAWADKAYVKVTTEDGMVSWVMINGIIKDSYFEINGIYALDDMYDYYYLPAISLSTKSIIDLNEVWSESDGSGTNYHVTSIGVGAFYNCSNLTFVTIPSSVTSIGDEAFYGCFGLTSVTIPSSVSSIGSVAFSGCSSLTSVVIPSSVTSIRNSTFSGCSSLTFVTIPSSVTSIGRYAFESCSSLTSVTIPSSVTSWDNAFFNCSGLTNVIIEEGVSGIGKATFKNCTSLTTAYIPNTVTSIGNEAFSGCTNLKDITTEITDVFITGTDAFKGCENATLHVPAGTYVAYSGRADWNRIIHIEEAAPAEEGFQMTLACNTKGSVLVNGKTSFTNKIKDVEVNEEEENTFEFIPNEGCRLEQVTLNGLDVTLSVSKNKLTAMIPAKSQMMVVFSKSNDINGDGNVDISDVVSLVNFILGQ